jgi:hypothetical protein
VTDGGATDQALRAELLARMERDQAARSGEPGSDVPEELRTVDLDNARWLAALLQERGWPLRSEVGEDGSLAAWLIAQHADQDPPFQRRCLGLLAEAVQQGEADPSHLAYLTDRVGLAENRGQLYGTQIVAGPDGYRPRELADPERVDERRAAVGLPSLAEYLAQFEAQGPPRPSVFPCPECGAGIEFWPPERGGGVDLACSACAWQGALVFGV